jgi:hypothetical protein
MNALEDETCKHGILVRSSHFAPVERNQENEGTKFNLSEEDTCPLFTSLRLYCFHVVYAWNDCFVFKEIV